jgi:hypothetical protein
MAGLVPAILLRQYRRPEELMSAKRESMIPATMAVHVRYGSMMQMVPLGPSVCRHCASLEKPQRTRAPALSWKPHQAMPAVGALAVFVVSAACAPAVRLMAATPMASWIAHRIPGLPFSPLLRVARPNCRNEADKIKTRQAETGGDAMRAK